MDGPLTQRMGFIPPYGPGRSSGEPPLPARKPLIDVKEEWARQWSWTDHAIERLASRGIGVFEVLSAIYAPDWTTTVRSDPKKGDATRKVVRGDIEVAYRPDNRLIITVIDRLEDRRTKPREPLEPVIVRHTQPFDAHPHATALTDNAETMRNELMEPDTEPAAAVVGDSSSVVESPTAEAARKETSMSNTKLAIPSKASAKAAVEAWLNTVESGSEFFLAEILEALYPFGYSRGALEQGVRALVRSGEIIRMGIGRYALPAKVPAQRQPSHVDSPPPAVETNTDDVAPTHDVVMSNGHKTKDAKPGRLELTDVWIDGPPNTQRDHDGLIAHINAHLEELQRREGKWWMAAKHRNGQAASSRLKTLRDAFPFLTFITRGGAIYVSQQPEK